MFYNQLFPKTACYVSVVVIFSSGASIYYEPSQLQFFIQWNRKVGTCDLL